MDCAIRSKSSLPLISVKNKQEEWITWGGGEGLKKKKEKLTILNVQVIYGI